MDKAATTGSKEFAPFGPTQEKQASLPELNEFTVPECIEGIIDDNGHFYYRTADPAKGRLLALVLKHHLEMTNAEPTPESVKKAYSELLRQEDAIQNQVLKEERLLEVRAERVALRRPRIIKEMREEGFEPDRTIVELAGMSFKSRKELPGSSIKIENSNRIRFGDWVIEGADAASMTVQELVDRIRTVENALPKLDKEGEKQ